MEEVERHKADCLARWQQLEAEAWQKWRAFKSKRLSRANLEAWLKEQDSMDELTIRGMFNRLRGK